MSIAGLLADSVLAVTALELLALLLWRRVTGHGPVPGRLTPTVLAGMMLALAWRLSLGGAHAAWIGLALLASLVAHATDIAGRWR